MNHGVVMIHDDLVGQVHHALGEVDDREEQREAPGLGGGEGADDPSVAAEHGRS
jgi:hypothetical protein